MGRSQITEPYRLWVDFSEFTTAVQRRLTKGARTYRNRNLRRSPTSLIGEIMEELEDVAGWACLCWARLRRSQAAAQALPGLGKERTRYERQRAANGAKR